MDDGVFIENLFDQLRRIQSPFFMVDLRGRFLLSTVNIFGRLDYWVITYHLYRSGVLPKKIWDFFLPFYQFLHVLTKLSK
jgi:hypothetical protein